MIHDTPDRHLYNPQLRKTFDVRQSISFLIHEYNVLRSRDQNTTFTVESLLTNLYKVHLDIPTADHPVRCLTSTYALTWIQSYDQRGSVISQLHTSLEYVSMLVHCLAKTLD